MSKNRPGTEVDPSEGTLDGTNVDESSADGTEEQVDPSEGTE